MTSENPLKVYYDALDRLKKGKPEIVPKGTKITNDAVSLEASRGKGSIKKSRPVFAELIAAIDKAAADQNKPQKEQQMRLEREKGTTAQLRRDLEAAWGREVSLIQELFEARKEIARLTGGKVIPIRGPRPNNSGTHGCTTIGKMEE